MNRKGFSLIEVLITSVILVISITAILTIYLNYSKILKSNEIRSEAVEIIDNLFEKSLHGNSNYNNLKQAIDNKVFDKTNISFSTDNNIKYDLAVIGTDVSTGNLGHLFILTATITWQNNANVTKSFSMQYCQTPEYK